MVDHHGGWGVTEGPGLTALGLAASRTVESSRTDAPIHDRFAPAFLDAADGALPFPTAWPGDGATVSEQDALHLHGSRFIGARSRWYDDVATVTTGPSQIVALASGLDMRAFRLDLPPSTRLFDVDQPAVVDFKRSVIAHRGFVPRCDWRPIGVDLRGRWEDAILARGFDPGEPSLWIAEGLLAYLSPTEEAELIAGVSSLVAPESRFALDFLAGVDRLGSRALVEVSRTSGVDMATLVNADGRPDLAEVLTGLGWDVHVRTAAEVAAGYRRSLEPPFGSVVPNATPPWLSTAFIDAAR